MCVWVGGWARLVSLRRGTRPDAQGGAGGAGDLGGGPSEVPVDPSRSEVYTKQAKHPPGHNAQCA